MNKHTPGPWRVVHTADDRTFIDTEESNDNFIAQIDRNIPEYESNAAFIVRACNAHEDLIAALKAARAALYNVPEVGKKYDQQHSHTHSKACLDIDIAIAKAEGRT